MWWRRRLWLLLTVVFLLRDAEGLGVWNKRSAPHWYGVATSASVAQPQEVDYLPYLTKMEGSPSSVASKQSSSVFPRQGPEPGQTPGGWSRSASRSQMDSSAQTASGSAGYYQSVFQGGQQLPRLVTQPQLQDSSGSGETQFQGQSANRALGTPQTSSSLFQQGVWHQGSAGSLDSVSSAQGFPSQYTGSRTHAVSVQSAPTHQGDYRAPSSGHPTYHPSKKLQPPHVPFPQSQSYTQLKSRLFSLASHSASGSSGVTTTGRQPVKDAQQRGAVPSRVSSRWQTWRRQTGSDVPQKSSYYAFLPAQSASSGLGSTSQQGAGYATQKSSSYYGLGPVQGASMWQSSSQQSGRHAPQTSTYYGPFVFHGCRHMAAI
ncbi:uncharacterized protein LOC118242944 [Electrophorus electricus]|uniref:uncharacterized protein LOC118242944 n=1 Tax=Electrophorus electricus TaxID=8005 RepID=UPI0015CFAA05|nr:uncharacterized protein LOC118242944 [Electrophorus electricus]